MISSCKLKRRTRGVGDGGSIFPASYPLPAATLNVHCRHSSILLCVSAPNPNRNNRMARHHCSLPVLPRVHYHGPFFRTWWEGVLRQDIARSAIPPPSQGSFFVCGRLFFAKNVQHFHLPYGLFLQSVELEVTLCESHGIPKPFPRPGKGRVG